MKPSNKRQVPLKALLAAQNFYNLDKGRFEQTEPDDGFCLITDPNPSSDFFFWVKNVSIDRTNQVVFVIERSPYSEYVTGSSEGNYMEESVEGTLREWVSLIETYESVKILPDQHDTVLEGYKEEFYDGFELVDEDANKHGYTLTTQLMFDAYYERIAKRLGEYKEQDGVNEEKKEEINEIIEDINQARDALTESTKHKTLQKLAEIWAKMRKAGLKVLSEAKVEFMKEVIKQGVKGLLDNQAAPIDIVTGLFDTI